MKISKIIVSSLIFIIGVACSGIRKMTYEFPTTMSESVKKEYIRQCEKGAVLYEISCAKCHTQ